MCGIVGYIGGRKAAPILLEGLRRLEYRGYDSAGIALGTPGKLHVCKRAGRVEELVGSLCGIPEGATVGIAHTRWATHGAPNEINAHPHLDSSGKVAVVHNGIIENYAGLKDLLRSEGVVFSSDTDTEVLAHLISRHYQGSLAEAVRAALELVRGTYGLAVLHADHDDQIVVARQGSPLIVGIGDGEMVVASDASAIVSHTSRVIYLSDGEIAVLKDRECDVRSRESARVHKDIQEIETRLDQIEKGDFEHFMLKEIFEQPESIANTLRGRLRPAEDEIVLGGLSNFERDLARINRLILVACGTSWHAALVAEYIIETLARLPVEVEYASEFRYRNPVLDPHTAVLAVSQSGETADTLAAVREAKRRGALVLGLVNVVASSIARETDAGVYLHAGPEIGVASTKAFTSQLAALSMIALMLARQRHLSQHDLADRVRDLVGLPDAVKEALATNDQVRDIAIEYAGCENWLYLGRGELYPVAMEGALKLKEISYIHAEGLAAAEMKHGPIALITPEMPVVILVNEGPFFEKILANVEEVRSRGGKIVAVAPSTSKKLADLADHVIEVPRLHPLLQPLSTVIPLQLMAYHAAVKRGCNVDKPRNLAKSVTVE